MAYPRIPGPLGLVSYLGPLTEILARGILAKIVPTIPKTVDHQLGGGVTGARAVVSETSDKKPKFVQMIPMSGVYEDGGGFMIVPQGGFNLVYLRNARGYHIVPNHKLSVAEIKVEQVKMIANDYLKSRAISSKSQNQLINLQNALYGGTHLTASGKSLLVKPLGKVKGPWWTTLIARRGNDKSTDVQLGVGVLPKKEYSVTFRFVKHLNDKKEFVPLTKLNPTQAQEWINQLNWIFGAQANIYFKLRHAEWINVKRALPQPMNITLYKETLPDHRDTSVQLTHFLVGEFFDNRIADHAVGIYFPEDQSSVISEKQDRVLRDDLIFDPFIVVMAHEFMHFVRDMGVPAGATLADRRLAGNAQHHRRGLRLMSKPYESCEMDTDLLKEINPWFKSQGRK